MILLATVKMTAADVQSKNEPVDCNPEVCTDRNGNIHKSTCASIEPSAIHPVDHILEASVVEIGNISKPANGSNQLSKIHPLDHEATIISPKHSSKSTFSQVLATLIQNWLLLDIGMELAMPTLVLGALHKNLNESLCMDDDQASWFGSMSHFFHPIGSIISGFLQEQFGRKGSMILVNIPIFAAWLTLYFADSIGALYAVSITLGLCCGFSEAPLHSFIGEIGEPHLRGTLATLSTSSLNLGCLFTYLLGYLVDWRTAALIASSIPVITFVCMTQIPESPTWLIKKHRLDDAQKSLSWLRGWVKPVKVQGEFQALLEYAKNSIKGSTVESHEIAIHTYGDFVGPKYCYLKIKFREITDKKVLLPLRLVFIAFFFQGFTILFPLKPYMVGILRSMGTPINSMLILIISSSSFSLGAMANVVFLRRYGKRKMALISHGLATTSILMLGIYCSFLQGFNWIPGFIWIPMVLFINVDFCCGLCVGLLPGQLVCEVFPLLGRNFASGLSLAWAYAIAFIMSKLHLYLEAWMKLSGIMYLYGVISFLGVLYHYFYLPETEGKSLEKIETYFTKNHDRKEKFSLGKKGRD